MEFFVFMVSIIVVGGFLSWYLERCPHSWELIDKGDIKSRKPQFGENHYRKTGYYEIHRCYNCKKLKKTEI